MCSPVRNDRPIALRTKSRGIVLLAMLGIILIAITAVAISHLSQNSGEQKAKALTTQALVQARDAIIANALMSAAGANPPGTLPCPDGDGNGLSDTLVAGACPNQRGLVPYLTLGIPQPLDGTGAPIWYVVSAQYSGNPPAAYNSSTTSALVLNATQPMAFILFAPNAAVGAQVRTTKMPLAGAVAQFLEGENSNGTPNTYTDLISATQNDQVLGVSSGAFWSAVEARVITEVGALLLAYRNSCGQYPWPVPYTPITGNSSDSTIYEGRIPLGFAGGTTLPSTWGATCAPILPTWLAPHWGSMLYLAMCKPAIPVNPPVTSCIDLGNGNKAKAIVIAPGIALSTQNRVTFAQNNYFESANATSPDNLFTQTKVGNHSTTFNDLIFVIEY